MERCTVQGPENRRRFPRIRCAERRKDKLHPYQKPCRRTVYPTHRYGKSGCKGRQCHIDPAKRGWVPIGFKERRKRNPDCRRGEYSRHKSCRRRRRKLFRTEVEGRLWRNKKQSVNKPPQIPVKTAWVYVFNVIPGCFYIPVPYFFYKNIRKLDRTKSQINDTVELQHTLKSD